jgi:hypothetical protein
LISTVAKYHMHYYYCSDDQFRASTTLKQPTYLIEKKQPTYLEAAIADADPLAGGALRVAEQDPHRPADGDVLHLELVSAIKGVMEAWSTSLHVHLKTTTSCSDGSTSKIEEQLVAHEYVPASFRQPELLAIEPRVSCLGQNGAVRVSIL